jgi:erythromycin esterase-like protein
MIRRLPFAGIVLPLLLGCRVVSGPNFSKPPASLAEWVSRDGISFRSDSTPELQAALRLLRPTLDSITVLGFGEPLHMGEGFLQFRNRLFRELVLRHGFTSIAIESGFPESHVVNDYVQGGPGSYQALADSSFGWGFGQLVANRELIEWMRSYNADSTHHVKLRFYGFDLSSSGSDDVASPARPLRFALEYLAGVDTGSRAIRHRIDSLLPMVFPPGAPPNPPAAARKGMAELRAVVEDLVAYLDSHRPGMTAASNAAAFAQALQEAIAARQTLAFHATADQIEVAFGIRDASMAQNLEWIMEQERTRGKIFIFAHDGHLQRSRFESTFRSHHFSAWPFGSQLNAKLGNRYAVIGSGLVVSDTTNGVARALPGTIEGRLASAAHPELLLPLRGVGAALERELAPLPVRSGSTTNPSFKPLTATSFTDFDWLYLRDSTGLARTLH